MSRKAFRSPSDDRVSQERQDMGTIETMEGFYATIFEMTKTRIRPLAYPAAVAYQKS
jgi:hypothetical protein